mgnify:CR=1 FL=1
MVNFVDATALTLNKVIVPANFLRQWYWQRWTMQLLTIKNTATAQTKSRVGRDHAMGVKFCPVQASIRMNGL